MAIFPVLSFETILQVNDKTRLDASQSYKSGPVNNISLYEIDPGDGNGFRTVTADKFLDIQYDSPGEKEIILRINNATTPPTTQDGPEIAEYTLNVITSEDDLLFSNDAMLQSH